MQVCLIISNKFRYIWRFHHIIADESRQRFDAEKFVSLMEMQISAVHANAAKKFSRFVESFNGCIPSERQHMFFTLQQTAFTVVFGGIGTVAPVAGIQFAVPCGKYFINIFF